MFRRFAALMAVLPLCLLAYSDTTAERAESYISTYSSLAVSEMCRSGIPASITLAQGLLESGYGRSTLATKANNHFGIKCHSDWKGESVYHDDDAKGECFRKYPKAEDSYRDHSDFLRFKSRYAFLFELEMTDYKAWAHGLKKAGYATDPRYAYKLINIIETYRLDRFDRLDSAEKSIVPETPLQLEQPVKFTGSGRSGTFALALSREVLQINGTAFIYARRYETYASIALLYDLFPKELAAYNDSKDPSGALQAGEIVYLQRKRNQAVRGLEKHICSEGDNLRSIAQKYGVSLKALMKLNGITDPMKVLREDDTILLRKPAGEKGRKEKAEFEGNAGRGRKSVGRSSVDRKLEKTSR